MIVNITSEQKYFNGYAQVAKLGLSIPNFEWENIPYTSFYGFDPGTTHLGMVEISLDRKFTLYQCDMEREKNPVDRITKIQNILQSELMAIYTPSLSIIEGASFGDKFRQSELAEVRATIAIWMKERNSEVSFISPLQVKKRAFGSAKVLAHEYWPNLPKDAAAALSCALYYTFGL